MALLPSRRKSAAPCGAVLAVSLQVVMTIVLALRMPPPLMPAMLVVSSHVCISKTAIAMLATAPPPCVHSTAKLNGATENRAY